MLNTIEFGLRQLQRRLALEQNAGVPDKSDEYNAGFKEAMRLNVCWVSQIAAAVAEDCAELKKRR